MALRLLTLASSFFMFVPASDILSARQDAIASVADYVKRLRTALLVLQTLDTAGEAIANCADAGYPSRLDADGYEGHYAQILMYILSQKTLSFIKTSAEHPAQVRVRSRYHHLRLLGRCPTDHRARAGWLDHCPGSFRSRCAPGFLHCR